MKILIDIGHPAHVHYFKNFAWIMLNKGHEIFFTCRNKDVTVSLLEHYNFKFKNLGNNFKSIPGKIFGLFYFTFRILLIARRYKPDLFLNATMYSAIVAWLVRKPHISLEDTFNKEQVKIYLPFTSCVLTGDYDHPSLGEKEIKYRGYQELLYLHPNYFKPENTVLKELGLSEHEPFVIMRFVSWNASHDSGHKGISYLNKVKAINEFERYAKVFITSESELPDNLKKNKIKISPYRMHDALFYATLVIGESFTMLSEAAILGTPSILIHDTHCYYLAEQQHKFNLAYNFSESAQDQIKAIDQGIDLLKMTNLKQEWIKRRADMLADKIDVTAFLVWFVENWPDSYRIMRGKPDYPERFK